MRDGLAFQRALVVEVELLQGFAGREPRGADPAFTAVRVAGGHFALQAGGQKLLVGPALRAGPLGEPLDAVAQRGRFQRPGQVGDLRRVCAASARPPRWSWSWWPSRHLPVVEAERPVVGGQITFLHLVGGGSAPGRAAVLERPAHHVGGLTVLRVGDALLPRPAPRMFGDQHPAPADTDRVQVRGDLDPLPDRAPGAPSSRRSPAARSSHAAGPGCYASRSTRVDRRQHAHRGPVRADPLGRRRPRRLRRLRTFARARNSASWALKSAGPLNRRPGQERGLEDTRCSLRQTLGLRIARAGTHRTGCPATPATP